MKNYYIPMHPMGAPRQTRSDIWKKRKVVVLYRAWRDKLMYHMLNQGFSTIDLAHVARVDVLGFYPIPKSWSQSKSRKHAGHLMRNRSDADNLTKAVCDTLYRDSSRVADSVVGIMAGEQRWEDALVSRMIIRIYMDDEPSISLFDYEPMTGGSNLARLIHRTTN